MARARWAEALAVSFYERGGYEVIARNWHCREGEIDFVATLNCATRTIIAVVEVKARATDNYGSPLDAITKAKQKKLRIAATKFLAGHPDLRGEVRFDAVSVLGTKIEVLHDIF